METAINTLPRIDLTQSTTNCCPLINPADWEDKAITFDGKLFAKATTQSLLHIPLNMGQVMAEAQAKIDAANARAKDFIILSHEVSPWHANHYLAVSYDVPGLAMEKISGRFMTKVFEGPYKDVGKWYSQLIEYVKSKGMTPQKTYLFYTACPKCAKTYGKNYVIGFEQVSDGMGNEQ